MRIRLRALVSAAFAATLFLASTGLAQVRVDALTEVRTIRFTGVHTIPERRLRELVQTRDRGSFYGLRVALGMIPFVPAPTPHPFSPLVLQQDVARLRRVSRRVYDLEQQREVMRHALVP